MVKFRTEVEIPPLPDPVRYDDKILLMGSCFTEHIGKMLDRYRFQIDLNPFGVVYNPASIAIGINRLLKPDPYRHEELFQHDDLWHSYDHHSRFSGSDSESCLNHMNEQLVRAAEFLRKAKFLILTFGTARVYRLAESGRVVTNCHKVPALQFEQELLRVGDIVYTYQRILADCFRINPDLNVILTVSPIRYLKEGPLGNQVSKSTLLLACSELMQKIPKVHYFPAYEIFMDDLRDYRFYDTDLIHPGEAGIDYVWYRFVESCMDPGNLPVMEDVDRLIKAIGHRSRDLKSPRHREFLKTGLDRAQALQVRYPFMDLRQEIEYFRSALS